VITAPDGSDAWAPAKLRPDETLIRALARAHRWKRMLEKGRFRSTAEIAEAEKIGRSFVNRLLRLTLLAPDIQEAILEGRQPKGMQPEELTKAMPKEWKSQRQSCSQR
jgi:ribosome-binding protein aMBF1 (putative translation factor)